ncbi:GrpB family protein [Wukongibacter baidiensis]|uniref:GrpB family protein n=1 Tax=Wukongibacter baidiensis TaxID=1723361 RepID=UPI003D7FEEE8
MSEQKQIRIIEVVPYNSQWRDEYQREAEKICSTMPNEIVEIHHIGSTSIPNIHAKPVIDILIGVKDIEKVDKYNKGMEELGYIPKGELGILGRRFFLKGLYNRTHHVHIFQAGNPEIERHLNFRDYMIAHPDKAKNYEELKKDLAAQFRYDNVGYCNGKDAFVKDIDKKAEEWAKRR